MMISPGSIFHNRYELLARVGKGGFSEVWRALDTVSGIIVAVKILHKQEEDSIALCREEYIKTFDLSHPNIVLPFHFDVNASRPFLVMRFIEGGTLNDKIGMMTSEEADKMIDQIGSALKYLHFRNQPVIHGDLKPDNILIDKDGNYYLTDFGISIQLKQKFTQTMSLDASQESGKGITPMAFRPPENFKYRDWSVRPLTQRSDIWSMGVTLYQSLYGQLPFNGEGGLGQLIMMKSGNHALSEILDVPEDTIHQRFEPLLNRLLSLNPDDRPQIFQNDLETSGSQNVAVHEKLHQTTQSPYVETIEEFENPVQSEGIYSDSVTVQPKSKKKDRRFLIALIFLGLVALGLTGFLFTGNDSVAVGSVVEDTSSVQEMILISDDTIPSLGQLGGLPSEMDNIQDYNMTSRSTQNPSVSTVNVGRPKQNDPFNITSPQNNNPAASAKTSSGISTIPSPADNETSTILEIPNNQSEINKSEPILIKEPEAVKIPEKKPATSKKTAIVKPNISIPLRLNETIGNASNYKSGDKISFIVANDVASYNDIILKAGTEVFAVVTKSSSKKLNFRFGQIRSSGGTMLKKLNLDNFELEPGKDPAGKIYRPVTSGYQHDVLID